MRTLLLTALFLTATLAGCTANDDGSLSLYVKDAPTDEFDEIHVVFTEVRVHVAGSEADSDDNATDNGTTDGEWITVFENATGQDIDLLAASGDASAFLGEADLTAGKYTQIRVIVVRAYGVDAEGAVTEFTVSSGTVKVVGNFEVTGGEETKVTVDFDLDRSIHQQGVLGDSWRMTPVIGQVIVEHVDDDASGEDVDEEGEIVNATA